ncbi:HAMP domain-containing sensor histidine kinase [Nocardioides dubius]|uniref:histidine kinase n=1 Tax=Nocardioides dubius TaxID=317019 RepID=A0ABP4E958_9ACTN
MRTRITAAVSFTVALTLALVGLLIYTVESARLHERTIDHASQEIAEFDKLQRGRDPETGEAFTGLEPLFRLYIQRNVPNDAEVLVAWFDGEPGLYSLTDPLALAEELTRDPAITGEVRSRLGSGGDAQVATDHGDVLVTVQPVTHRASGEQGALVLLTLLDATRADLMDLLRTYLLIALSCWALITLLAAWQAGRLLSPLRQLSDTAREISGSDLSRRIPETGNDDITELTRTLNQMLARLESTFAEQRQFLDAAGHELKTPLTVLRGHLELLDAGDPAEVAETRALLIDEIDRMARLVGDLILLAKSARPDFVVAEPADLRSLTSEVLAKASALAERDWVDDGGAEVVVGLDRQRITQALLQLADNAVKHTGTGDAVAIGSRDLPDRVELWVRDTGAGVPEADRERIFERFGRSRVPAGDEGFGLGLSIVRAIAEAHGGTAHVEPTTPHGARFVITLPRPREDTWPAS